MFKLHHDHHLIQHQAMLSYHYTIIQQKCKNQKNKEKAKRIEIGVIKNKRGSNIHYHYPLHYTTQAMKHCLI